MNIVTLIIKELAATIAGLKKELLINRQGNSITETFWLFA
jgi:hypothetical protein